MAADDRTLSTWAIRDSLARKDLREIRYALREFLFFGLDIGSVDVDERLDLLRQCAEALFDDQERMPRRLYIILEGVHLGQTLPGGIAWADAAQAVLQHFDVFARHQRLVVSRMTEPPIEVPVDDEPAPPYLLLRLDLDGNEVDIVGRFWTEEEASSNLRADWMYELRRGRGVIWRRPKALRG